MNIWVFTFLQAEITVLNVYNIGTKDKNKKNLNTIPYV